MGIYTLPLKNLRRNRLRNISMILRITLGVIVLLILVSSGLGITSFLAKSEASNGNILYGNNTNLTTNSSQANVVSALVSYFNSVLGSNFSENQLLNRGSDNQWSLSSRFNCQYCSIVWSSGYNERYGL